MLKLGRNDQCWCGSGKKYKVCHAAFDEKLAELKAKGEQIPPHKLIKTPAQLDGIRKAGKLNTEILDMVAQNIHAGMTTDDINKMVHEYTVSHGGVPAPLGYCGFPKSVCTSVNDVICHGIPSEKEVLQDGDIINVDVTTILDVIMQMPLVCSALAMSVMKQKNWWMSQNNLWTWHLLL